MIYQPDCVPDGFTLSDPDHLPASNIILLYRHWLECQKNGLSPFVVLNPSPLHAPMIKKAKKDKGKKKAVYLEVSDDDEDVDGDGDEDCNEDEDEDEDESDDDEDSRNDDSDAEKEDEPKIGPPTGKKNAIPPSKKSPIKVAGPSSQPFHKPPMKGRSPKTSKGQKLTGKTAKRDEVSIRPTTNSPKKRRAEDELVNNSPKKIQRTSPARKSGRLASKTEVKETDKVSLLVDDFNRRDLCVLESARTKEAPGRRRRIK